MATSTPSTVSARRRTPGTKWTAGCYFYPSIAGFFFDQQSVDVHDVGYYLELRDYARSKIKGKQAFIVTNPGTTCDEQYFAKEVSDVTCLFASFKGFDEFNPPVLLKRYSPSRFAALPYHIPNSKAMRQVLQGGRGQTDWLCLCERYPERRQSLGKTSRLLG